MERFIAAGAGSGKTYKITTEVAKRVKDGELSPEQVIMTTYTKAAAQELKEKTKQELVNAGCPEGAIQIEHALIGTMHSVANTFLTKYWYLLGIMPDACAIEENELDLFRDQSLRGLMKEDDRKFIYNYCEKYNIAHSHTDHESGLDYEFWKKDIVKVLDFMQWYNITDEQMDKSLNETTESIIKLLVPKEGRLENYLTDEFYGEVEAFFGLNNKSTPKKEAAHNFYISLNNDTSVTAELYKNMLEHLKLEINNNGTKHKLSGPATESLKAYISSCILCSEDKKEDHREYARIIFELAKEWRKQYRTFKDEHHLIDFNDMEEMFLKLLDIEEVQEDIKAQYKCIYVDEFQDSNPIQVKIFRKLATLINACYVGDKKQAIYAFRGSDTELTDAIADSIENKETLQHSFRSVKPLVNLSNTIFKKVFNGMEDVELTMPEDSEKGNREKVEKPLRLWHWGKNENLAQQIKQLILREKIDCKDIAVLAHKNDDLDKLAKELRKIGVPVCRESEDINESRTGRLIKALLTLVVNPSNLMARAEIAYLAEPEYNLKKIIEERFANKNNGDNKDYLEDIGILARLNEIRNDIKSQGISAMIESLIIELNLYALVRSWDNHLAEETNLQVFIDLARSYEDSATKLAHPATVAGFIDYFSSQNQKGAVDDSGVRLCTYHKSKGLEWKVVIMLSLETNLNNEEKIAKNDILGCQYHRSEKPTSENPSPEMTISLVRNIYSNGNTAFPPYILSCLKKHERWNDIFESKKRELSRLLYVGVTRARNVLILAAKETNNGIDLNWFRTAGLDNVKQTLVENAQEEDVLGIGINFAIESIDENNLKDWPEEGQKKTFDIAKGFSKLDNQRNIMPSKAGSRPHELGKIINEKEIRIQESVKEDDYAQMGDFIHQVFCCMDDDITKEDIVRLRDEYGFTSQNMSHPEELIGSWDYLTHQLEANYGKSVRRIHELPFRHIDEGGHLVSGYIDFIWETEDGYVIVDYKTCASNYRHVFEPTSEHYAGKHGDQLDCYQKALGALGGKQVKARLIYYPITRFLTEVK